MDTSSSRLLFDRRDHELLALIEDVLGQEQARKTFRNLLNPHLNPHGIKEMAASQGFRIAYAMADLLHSLEIGKAADRVGALRALRDEVLNITHSSLRRNTARVLLQIMKELVRITGDQDQRLALAHDFRMAVSGRPRFIRELLQRYHLLEMPEEWNQIAFDDHVHDANTKGRKTSTHLIMDAWIKGIRRLTVVYYNYVTPEAAAEILEAGEIMGITIRIGISVGARFRGRTIRLIWVPRGFCDSHDFLSFLADPSVRAFLDEEREVSEHHRRYVIAVLDEFNKTHRVAVNETFGVSLPILSADDFLGFVGSGQPSILHLGEFIHAHLLPLMEARVADLRTKYAGAMEEERRKSELLVTRMRELDSGKIVAEYLNPAHNPSLPDPTASPDSGELPPIMRLAPHELIMRLDQLHAGYRISLNLSDLAVEDVLEILYDCKGMVSHLEIFNLKDYVDGKAASYEEISELQSALNEGNVVTLKRLIRMIRHRLAGDPQRGSAERIAKLTEVLGNIPALQAHYRAVPLGAYISSDSAGRSLHHYGMGLILRETLTRRAQEAIQRTLGLEAFTLPVRMTAYLRTTYLPDDSSGGVQQWVRNLFRGLPGFRDLGEQHRHDWVLQDNATRLTTPGNLVTLGGLHEEGGNELSLEEKKSAADRRYSWRYLNSGFRNAVKVLIGFVPAFLTFALTQDWWLLAYGGAFIWFGITGLRNVLQSVLGGGGIRRSPLLRWNDYVSWDRLIDSLLFTGFSVPLLEYVVKTVLLEQAFGVTTATNPTLLYASIALANGCYLFAHNSFRGLPKGAIYGGFFRTIFSIPLAVAFNAIIGGILSQAGAQQISAILQKWAVVISKAASDSVAGVIEGFADRYENIRVRERDYDTKLNQIFDAYAQLELLYPEKDVLSLVGSAEQFVETIGAEARDLEKIIIGNALDLLYFWMYQPRARSVLAARIEGMSEEELQIFVHSQFILQREKEISQLFLDGIIGRNFSRGLAFYLDRYAGYLENLRRMAARIPPRRRAS